jgi:hypothetical protein
MLRPRGHPPPGRRWRRLGRPRSCRLWPAGFGGVCGLLADGHHYPKTHLGAGPGWCRLRAGAVPGTLLLSGRCCTPRWRLAPDRLCGGRPLGELGGGNRMAVGDPCSLCSGDLPAGTRLWRSPPWNSLPPARAVAPRAPSWRPGVRRIVTWLILPVVICLSQRLSHACLSISNYTVKLRMAH